MGIVFASSRANALIALVASYPFITGICTSIKIASNSPSAAFIKRSTANLPFSTTTQSAPSILRISSKISALISLSSAARKCSPSKLLLSISVSSSLLDSTRSSDIRNSRSTRNRVPLFTSLETLIVPPISSTIFLVIAIPSPVPCTLLVVLFSALVNASKIVSKYSGVIPKPLSSTSIRICSY